MPRARMISLVVLIFTLALFAPGVRAESSAQQSATPEDPRLLQTAGPTATEQPATETPTATQPPPATETPTATQPPTEPPATATPTATATQPQQPGFYRPLVVIADYRAKPKNVVPGGSFNLEFQVLNQGQLAANNIIITFTAGELIPRDTGGVVSAGSLDPGQGRGLSQAFTASSSLAGAGAIALQAQISYTDLNGNSFSESFSLAINTTLPQPTSRPSGPAGPTPTPTGIVQPFLVIQDTKTDVAMLQPGTRFVLELMVVNVGNADAKRVTMVAGGATVSSPDPNNPPNSPNNGTVNSSGEFTNFSPLGASNVQSLGDIPAGGSIVAHQPLIVNVSTNPGAYSFKISFVYFDATGNLVVNDQVITLLVFLQPVLEVSFYRDPGPLFAGQPNALPLQIINLGRKSVVLGNMRVTAPAGQLMNNTVLIGTLDAGGYFTLDASFIPDVPGPVELTITVDYNDDFNQPQSITRTVPVEILEMPIIDQPPVDGGAGPGVGEPMPPQSETLWQIAVRFVRGMVGLGSGVSEPLMAGGDPGGPRPSEGFPPPGESFGPAG